eukprot:COSAG05_NODE_78_length_21399_cov_26.298216_23_plen_82_part_00
MVIVLHARLSAVPICHMKHNWAAQVHAVLSMHTKDGEGTLLDGCSSVTMCASKDIVTMVYHAYKNRRLFLVLHYHSYILLE